MTTNLIITETTVEQIINDENANAYNPSTWKERTTSYLKYEDVRFYKSEGLNDYNEHDYFVAYTTKEGLRFWSQISYTSCLHNGGFTRMIIVDGKYMTEELIKQTSSDPNFKGLTTNNLVAYKRGFGKDQDQRVTNSKEGRKWLAENICKYGTAVTNN
jgi:hypothetical protein